jgi:hypothetical protein
MERRFKGYLETSLMHKAIQPNLLGFDGPIHNGKLGIEQALGLFYDLRAQ